MERLIMLVTQNNFCNCIKRVSQRRRNDDPDVISPHDVTRRVKGLDCMNKQKSAARRDSRLASFFYSSTGDEAQKGLVNFGICPS